MNKEQRTSPPGWALYLLRWFCRAEWVEDIEGDLVERFERTAKSGNYIRARKQFVREVFTLIRPGLVKPISNSYKKYNIPHNNFIKIQKAMFNNIIKTTIRSLLKQKSYVFINTIGLTVGLASSFLILLWVADEYKIDKFHQNSERIFQLKRLVFQDDGQSFTTIAVPQPLELVLEQEYPEVDKVTLVGWDIQALFKNEDRSFKEPGKYVSPEFLQIFSFPFKLGDPSTALSELNSVVISENLAMKLFGNEWQEKALGESIPMGTDNEILKVTGVIANPPLHSTMQFQWLAPVQKYISQNNWVENWNNGGFRMAVLMKDGSNMDDFAKKVLNEVNKHIQGDERVVFQKFSDQYLYSKFENGVEQGGRIDYVRAMLVVAICIILIASINFMNLATARSAMRVKEIGVRKVLGAGRDSLTFQFLTEAILISLIATVFAVVILQLILPGFNQLTGKAIIIDYRNPTLWEVALLAAFLTGFISGIYPAFFLSAFKPLSVIRGQIVKIGGGALLRKALVIFQFSISIVLIISSTAIFRQIKFILNKNLGLDRENVVYVPLEGATQQSFEAYRTELLRSPNISNVASSDQNPLGVGRSTGGASWDSKDPNAQIEINVLSADENFIKTMKLELVEGSDFSGDFYQDSASFIINEQVAQLMGKENPVGENFSMWGTSGKVIGVVKDFHNTSLYNSIEPLVIRHSTRGQYAFIRIKDNIPVALSTVEATTRKFNPGLPFNYTFMDDQFEETYKAEIMIGDLTRYFTIIAIFISCLGLFGLSSFIAQQRVKEIGIRKVMGASTSSLFMLLSLNFGKLIILAFIIAAPIGYYFSNSWLEQFNYRINIGIAIFIIAGLGALIIAIATVSFKAIQVALANPVNSLKEE